MKITIWTGGSARPWGPDTLKTGIGGSETAAVHLALELATLGHHVAVVGNHLGHETFWSCIDDDGDLGTVQWIHAFEPDGATLTVEKIRPHLLCDAFISLRLKNAHRLFGALGTPLPKFTALWCQDLHCGSDWDGDVQAFDETWALTDFHRDFLLNFYTRLTRQKTWTTRNGLDLSRFTDVYQNKDFNHFTWSSSLDRGLEALLEFWPIVRGRLPKAELHVYYGPPVVPAHLQKDPVVERCWLMVERLSCMKRHGVHYHGRAGQDEVAESHKRSAFWLYPTDFQETSCITAMEAQAAGAVPICTAYGSLPEVAGGVPHVPGTCSTGSPPDLVARSWEPSYVPRGASPRGWLLAPPGRGKGWGEGLGFAFDRMLGEGGVGTEEWCLRSEACREWALKQSWAGIAREWGEHLKEKTGVW